MKKNSSEKKSGNKVGIIILVVVTLCLVGAAAFLAFGKEKSTETGTEGSESEGSQSESYEDYTKIMYNGQEYAYNTDITTVLFMGIDQFGMMDDGVVNADAGQSDALILMVMNKKEETIQLFSIAREAMTDVKAYDKDGEYYGTEEMQITLQYAYGDGAGRSAVMTRDAVSNMLYNIPINYYLAMNLDGLSTVVDAIGGMELYMDQDYTYVDPMFVQGVTIQMDGDLTEKFVRYRDITVAGSSQTRMARQEVFLAAFADQLKEAMSGKSEGEIQALWTMISPFMVTDMNVDAIYDMATYNLEETTLRLPGELKMGQVYEEFYINDDELQQLLVELLYEPK